MFLSLIIWGGKMNKKGIYILKIIFSLLFFFYFGEIVSSILMIFGIKSNNISILGQSIYQFVGALVLFGILLFIYFKEVKKDFFDFKENIKNNIRNIIKMFIIFMLVKFGVSLLSTIIMLLLKIDINSLTSTNQNIIEDLVTTAPMLMTITAGFIGPAYEEILFRLGFKNVIDKKSLFIIISGLVFGLMHIFPLAEGVSLTIGLIQSISYVSMGFVLAYIYSKYDNIFITIGIHFLNNFLSVITMITMM